MSALNIATRALTTNQAVLQVIGHNIANVNTEGYTRQRAELQAVAGQRLGSGYFGKGVQIETVARVGYDAFLTREANGTRSTAAADAIRAEYLRSVESLFPTGDGGLGQVLNDALNAWVDVANAPDDTTARQVVLSRFDALATRVRDTMARLDEITQGARVQAGEIAGEVNRLALAIAQVNESIARVAGSGVPPNDLLDQRDHLIAQLNEKIQVTTLAADDGTLSVFVAGSLPLVLGNQAARLEVARATVDSDRQIQLQFVQGATRYDIPREFVGGGQLRGLLDFINRDVVQTQAELGRVALATAEVLNRQQRSGLNALGAPGTDLLTYAPAGLQAKPGSENTSTATMTLTVADPAALRATDYDITYTSGTNVQIRRSSDGWFWNGTAWQPSAATLGTLPAQLDGLTLSISGTPAAGDRFYIRAGADAASSLHMPLASPAELAAANRVQLALGTPNNGNATIEAVSAHINSGSWAMPALPAALTFTAPNQFALAGFTPASVTYTPGEPMEFTYTSGGNSVTVRLTLRGQPQNGDVFQLQAAPTSGAALVVNGGNASAMLALRDDVLFDGTTPLSDGYLAVFSGLAARINEAQTRATFTRAQATDAEQRRANLAGVNLDEEAARLLQFQQAYQASAKYLQTVQSVFDTLLATFR
ncbi:flagellar hook-associated protein FlgK [Tepidimonas taiwanensis]|uniref:Flagellar hook-associated protein 1 n=1 Tax=Tepidimonas taiwanensis TaxID=307486 RepID=A0A554XCM6_9BURK|nr:flagellar hook-associated protein FlgK [Tepidimonas taiwanensis]MCX7693283.1 flagellar hook-associated protein FlgK [Tepidimonas taiwanensis]MDM7464212.1 flagellar hook-associated protein FlgK [Tepidimonas taiwanensis]TSE33514.1 Flagellar hook-associated protein 1 [Tepidimonas taiwanensis]UBQ05784.1 flagellar hook-associated protein FlgK [Tepidimonas taiwanensis]